MMLEHLLYTGALAVILGPILSTAGIADERPYLLLVIGAALVPDSAWVVTEAVGLAGAASPFPFLIAAQGGLHTLGALAVVTLLAGLALRPFSLRAPYTALCCAAGYGSHLLGDALTHTTRYTILWPLSPDHVGIGLFVPYSPDILGIAEARVLVPGLLLLALAIAARTAIGGRAWMREYAPHRLEGEEPAAPDEENG